MLGAVRIQAETAGKPGDFLNGADNRLADSWLQEATRPVEGTMMAVAGGGELLPAVLDDADMDSALGAIKNTVDEPNYITADASRDRIQLAFDAGALESGLDLSESIGAANSLEKMMARQLAATHRASMKLVQQLTRCIERINQPYNAEAHRARAGLSA